MSRPGPESKWKAWLALAGAILLSLLGLPLTLLSLAGVYELVKARLAGSATGKDFYVILLLVVGLWLLKFSWELWREIPKLRSGDEEESWQEITDR